MEGPMLVGPDPESAADAADGGGVSAFDYGSREFIPAARLRKTQVLFEKFLREVSATLSAFLGATVKITLKGAAQSVRSEFLGGAECPTCILGVSIAAPETEALFEISPSVLYPALGIMLGGGAETQGEGRAHLTEIEQSVLDLLFAMILRDLREAWRGVADIEFRLQRLWTDPAAADTGHAGEDLLVFAGEMSIGEASGPVNFGMPVPALEQIWSEAEENRLADSEDSLSARRNDLLNLLGPMPMSVEVRVQGATVLVREVCGLKVGDVLTVFHPVDSAVDGLVNGKPKFRGHLVGDGPKVAFRVDERIHSPAAPAATAG